MDKIIEYAVGEYFCRVDDEPVYDSKVFGRVVQECGLESTKPLQSAIEDRIYEMKIEGLDK